MISVRDSLQRACRLVKIFPVGTFLVEWIYKETGEDNSVSPSAPLLT